MKIKKIYILSLLVLFILMIGAVSAEDNLTENTDEALNGTVLLEEESAPSESEGSDDDSLYDYLSEVNLLNDHIAEGNDLKFVIANGEYHPNVEIDGKKVSTEIIGEDEMDTLFAVSTKGIGIGKHSFYINSTYINKTIPFWIENIVVRVPEVIDLNNYIYGNDLIIELANGLKDPVSVTIDGENKNI